ncbi:sensor histidine kinase [Solirubrobacter soli]|uniref:sensor histidine kinase n=1 Tax=Solirubrobacter soli TaxID=363832 RepID=UPI0003F7D5F4|nr:sensor histidine kinase [Solirubrobacter soli]
MSRLWPLVRGHAFDLLVVIGAIEAALEAARWHEQAPAPATSLWFAAPALASIVLVLLGRRRFPFAAPVAAWVLAAAVSFVDGALTVDNFAIFAAAMAASFLLGNAADVRQGRIGLAVVAGAAAIIVYNDPDHVAGDFIFVPALFAIAWLGGFALRAGATQAEAAELRATEAERAVFEERVRIARELHDVVAHHVSMMGVQAGAARLVIDRDPDKAKGALSAIETSSRQAVAELHNLLGFLRQAGDRDDVAPRPGLGELERLAASMRDSRLLVDVTIQGEERSLPPTVDVSAYRIVQEALTNTVKHSVASRADVHVRYWPDAVEVEIVDDGRPKAEASPASTGLGLIGMRERAALHGGQLTVGPASGGGFVVKARLPIPGGAR